MVQYLPRHTSRVISHVSYLTRHFSRAIPHASFFTCHTSRASRAIRRMPYLTCHTSRAIYLKCINSYAIYIAYHTSHVMPHVPYLTSRTSRVIFRVPYDMPGHERLRSTTASGSFDVLRARTRNGSITFLVGGRQAGKSLPMETTRLVTHWWCFQGKAEDILVQPVIIDLSVYWSTSTCMLPPHNLSVKLTELLCLFAGIQC